MNEIALTINDKQVKGKEGSTVLEVCEANGIHVPTLCHFKGLTDVGACRMCLVEIERERRPVPACTYPARDGLVVQTSTEKLEKHRRLVLELLFTERNHLCAYCLASGDCELQNLAYQYQIDSWRYPYSWPSLSLDSSDKYIMIDHNRCILCGRCVRVCSEKVGVHTLDFGYRGWRDRICADLSQPLGESSSCIECGACFQACPTGAIWAKSSAYRGRPNECEKIRSVCVLCGVGCEIDVLVKNNTLIRIDGADLTGDRGILCYRGRFDQLYERHQRVTSPLIRNSRGRFEACSVNKAFDEVGKELSNIAARYGKNSVAGVASSQASNEALKAFKKFMNEVIGSNIVDTIDGDEYRVIIQGAAMLQSGTGLHAETSLEEILKADCLLVVGINSLESQQIASSYIFRAASSNKANLIVLDTTRNPFGFHTSTWLKPIEGKEELAINVLAKAVIGKLSARNAAKAKKVASSLRNVDVAQASNEAGLDTDGLANAAALLAKSKHSVVVYGKDILRQKNPGLVASIFKLALILGNQNPRKPRIVSLKPRGNSRGAWNLGLANAKEFSLSGFTKNGVKAVYLLLADDYIDDSKIVDGLKRAKFVVVQASYSSPVTAIANVVLPSPTWAERKGSYTSLDGITKSTPQLTQPPDGIKRDEDIIRGISRRLRNK